MKLSIIVPCYNCEEYIGECLESVLKGLHAEDEVICIDDGSSDSTAKLLGGISDPRVIVVMQRNGGPGAARNIGIEASTGDQILFVDSDDVISASYIEIVKSQRDDCLNRVQLCVRECKEKEGLDDTPLEQIKSLKPQLIVPSKEEVVNILNAGCPMAKKLYSEGYDISCVFLKTYCRKILVQYNIRFPSGLRWGEDICFNIQYQRYIEEVYFFPLTAYWYRTVSGSLIHRYYPNKNLEIQKFLATLNSLLKEDWEREEFHYMEVKQYFFILKAEFCNRYNNESFLTRRGKALALIRENSLIKDGIYSFQLRDMCSFIGGLILLIRLRWFLPVDILIKLYSAAQK